MIPLENIKDIPIAMYPGTKDQVVDIEGNRDLRVTLADTLIDYNEEDADHMTFVLGKNMTYFKRVLSLVDQFNKKSEYKRQIDKVNEKKGTLTKFERVINKMDMLEEQVDKIRKEKKLAIIELEQK